MEWFKTDSTRRTDSGLSRKKTPCFCHSLETQTGIGAMSTPDGSLVEPRRNMAKSMAVFLEKPAILFAMFFDLRINEVEGNVRLQNHY